MTDETGPVDPMSVNALDVWLQNRKPEVPRPLLPLLLEGWEGPVDPSSLGARGVEVLHRALERPGRDRGAAFDLLAADALLTYACEDIVQERDIVSDLKRIMGLLGAVSL